MLRVASLLALGAALVEAAKKKVEAPPPEPTMMATLKDMVLFDGEFKFLFWVCLVGFCAGNLRMILTQTPNIRFVHGLVLGVLNCYGGSTLAAIICGQPVPFVVNEKLIVGFSLTWVVAYSLPAVFMSVVKGTSSGAILISVTYEILRCHVMINCHRMASGVLKAGLFGVPTIGPLICGTLGGCGGGFFPLNKGLEPLEGETNWRVTSAFYGACWLQLMADPAYSELVTGILPFLTDASWVRFCAIVGFALPPLLINSAMGPGYYPLGKNPLVGEPTATPAKKKN